MEVHNQTIYGSSDRSNLWITDTLIPQIHRMVNVEKPNFNNLNQLAGSLPASEMLDWSELWGEFEKKVSSFSDLNSKREKFPFELSSREIDPHCILSEPP